MTHLLECEAYPIPSDPCDESTETYTVPHQVPNLVDYVNRSTTFPAKCIQGYNLQAITSTVVPNVRHDTIDNDEPNVHTPISQVFAHLLTVPTVVQSSITGVSVSNITSTSAIVTWNTTKNVPSLVEYGLTPAYEGAVFDGALVQQHSVTLTGLLPSIKFHFSIVWPVSSNPMSTKDATFVTTR